MILNHLKKHIEVDDKILKFLREDCEKEVLEKREIFIEEGSKNRKVYFIEEGLVRTFYYDQKGKDITHGLYLDGAVLSSIDTIFKNVATRYSFETLEKSVLISCEYQKLEKLCLESVEYTKFMLFILGNLMNQMADRIAFLRDMSAKEKYQILMDEKPNILQRVPLSMVASYLGITQETLSRIRNIY